MNIKINIGDDFSHDPSGRFYKDGNASGEKFREELLKPKFLEALRSKSPLIIILDDDVETYGSSFLSEGFGGMVKKGYAQPEDLLNTLQFSYSDPDYKFYENRIREYIRHSKREDP
jgi:hypothetical protein